MGVPGSANFLLAGAQGYQIERSLRFNSADSAYLERTPASAGNRKTWTWSGWVKRGSFNSTYQGIFGSGTNSVFDGYALFWFQNDETLQFLSSPNNATNDAILITSAVFRDPSAWCHLVLSVDTTQATAANRVRIYFNGVQISAFSTATYPTQNKDLEINRTIAHKIGKDGRGSNGFYFNGYLTEVHFIDGQALTPSSFGETDTITGVWKPKAFSGGSYGTNGFYLKFADNSGTTSTTLGKDSSGNGNNWTPNNFSVTAGAGNDSMIDVPTPYADGGNGRGNYATLNAVDKNTTVTLSDGNLVTSCTASGHPKSTIGMTSGKWYWETVCTNNAAGASSGLSRFDTAVTNWVGQTATSYGYNGNGSVYNNNTIIASLSSYTTNDVIGVAFDATDGKLYFSKNGVWQNSANPAAGTGAVATGLTTRPYFAAVSDGTGVGTTVWNVNFGQRSFSYTPPSGFLALNTQNLPEPTIKKPSSYFDAKLYTGNGSTQTISGFDFSPDLVWIKSRSAATNNDVFDSVRGATVGFATNSTQAESTFSGVTAFNSNGFSLGSNTSDNANSATYVAWCWDESATPGFDIVTYTGNETNRTIAHSLGVAPSFLIAKVRDYSPESWFVWHSAFPGTDFVKLDSTDAKGTSASLWNSTVPTSSVFSLGTSAAANRNGKLFVAYLWSEVAGFSKFGSYTGNGSTDGPFVFCGFRPRFILFKNTTAYNWQILDTARADYNQGTVTLFPNLSNAENTTATQYDILSNGFKIRTSDAGSNGSGNSIIFAAFAESPFKYSLAR